MVWCGVSGTTHHRAEHPLKRRPRSCRNVCNHEAPLKVKLIQSSMKVFWLARIRPAPDTLPGRHPTIMIDLTVLVLQYILLLYRTVWNVWPVFCLHIYVLLVTEVGSDRRAARWFDSERLAPAEICSTQCDFQLTIKTCKF